MPERKWAACLYAVPNLPLVGEGDDRAGLLHASAARDGFVFEDGVVVVVAQKIVSKAEGATARLSDVDPSPRAIELTQALAK